MQFLSHGDFSFPFTFVQYMYKQLFMWSFRSGAPNPDGIIKMPGRLPELLLFAITGDNLVVSYFFIFSSLLLVFLAFYYFATRFLEIKHTAGKYIGALLFTLNPVFLGNLAKLGLIIAAAMLPVSLVAVREVFVKKQLRYLLLWILCLNVSLIHPFTFIVNAAVSGGYFVYLASKNRHFMYDNIRKIMVFGLVALLLNAYFLLPLAGMRTLSKDVINDSAASSPTDYTAMVEILSTRDLLTGFSLSKDVVVDFAYYDGLYAVFYFIGVIALYVLLFGMYIRLEKRISQTDKRRIALLIAAFLALILLAAVTVMHVDVLIKQLIQLPGGWAFRSPLKWQLYIPIALVTMLVLLLAYIKSKRRRMVVYGGLIGIFLLMNGFLFAEIYRRLLTPRTVTHFQSLQKKQFNYEHMLLVSNDDCSSPDMQNRQVRTELKQVLVSKDLQLKQIRPNQLSKVNLGSYDYIMDCRNSLQEALGQAYDFTLQESYAGNAYQLYANQKPKPYIYAGSELFATSPQQLDQKYAFASGIGKDTFNFVDNTDGQGKESAVSLADPYEDVSFDNIQGQDITSRVSLPDSGGQTWLYVRGGGQPLYYKVDGGGVSFTAENRPGYLALRPATGFLRIPLDTPADRTLEFSYADPAYDYTNLIPNASLEEGTWQKEVSDCYAYDNQADLSMGIDTKNKTEGKQALQLQATNHVACTGPPPIPVGAGQYLLEFDYRSDGGEQAGYAVMLNSPDRTVTSGRLRSEPRQWQEYTDIIAVPPESDRLRLLVHAYPDTPGLLPGTALYDSLRLAAIPDIQNKFYVVQEPEQTLQEPEQTSYRVANPTKSLVSVEGASTPFYLVTKESYNAKWQLALDKKTAFSWLPFAAAGAVPADSHFKVNGSMNAWYIDPAKLCSGGKKGCTRNADGSYDLQLVVEFTPQRWLYLGLLISGATLAGCVVYIAYAVRRSRNTKPTGRRL